MEIEAKNGWPEWGKFVLKELERLNACYDALVIQNQKMQVDIAMLKVKSGVWGFAAGLLPSLAVLILWIVKNTK